MSKILGTIENVFREVDFDTATAISAVNLSYTKPDGTTSLINAGTATPGTANVKQILSYQMIFNQPGAWSALWKAALPDAEELVFSDIYFVATTDMWQQTRDLLGRSDSQLPDALLEPEFAFITWELEHDNPCIGVGGYRTLGGADKIWFERAVAYLTAARIRIFNPDKYPIGPRQLEQKGLIRYAYFKEAAKGGSVNTNDLLLGEAYSALNYVSCVAAQKTIDDSTREIFAMAGPRRGSNTAYSGYNLDRLYIIASKNYWSQ